MKKLELGIIGCSKIAIRSIIPAIINSNNIELKIVGSRSKTKAKEVAKKFNLKYYGNYNDVLKSNVDIVYVSLPIALHEKWAIKAMENGKHVYCEKSSTNSFSSAINLIQKSKENKVRIMEGLMFRYHPQHKKVNQLKKKIGDIFSFSGNYGFPHVKWDDIRYNQKLGGGVLNETGCYPLNAARMIFNEEPESVESKLVFDKKIKIDVKGFVKLDFKKDKIGLSSFSFDSYYQASYKIWGKNGIISLNRAFAVPPNYVTKIIFEKNNIKKELKINPDDHFKLMIEDFGRKILKKKSDTYFENELINQAKLMEAVRLSNKLKKTIYLDEIN